MLTLYTAIGTLKFKNSENGNRVATVINNRREYGLSRHELLLWSCLAFQICQIHELQAAYEHRLQQSGQTEGLSFSHYLNRLILRGLVAKGDGLTGVDALYQLLGKLHIQPVNSGFVARLYACLRLCLSGSMNVRDIWRYLRKAPLTPMEETILRLSRTCSLTTAELLACVEHGGQPEAVLTHLYEDTEATYETLADEAQFLHIQYPVLQAIGNLYLNKQIILQQL